MSSSKNSISTERGDYFDGYCRQFTDMPMLVMLKEHNGTLVPDRFLRASDLDGKLGQENNPDWKTIVIDENHRLSGRAQRLDRFPLGAERHVESGNARCRIRS